MALKYDIKTQMTRFTKRLKGIVEDASSKEVMKEVGEQTVRLVQQQAKLGNDYLTGGKFKKLSTSYKDKRERYSDYLAARTRPRKSNVTATGQMLDAIKVSKTMPRSVELEVKGGRSPSAFDSGKLSNAEVAYYVEKQGRHFLGLSDKSRQKLLKFYDRIVKTILRRQK